jgi:hypothetical protein
MKLKFNQKPAHGRVMSNSSETARVAGSGGAGAERSGAPTGNPGSEGGDQLMDIVPPTFRAGHFIDRTSEDQFFEGLVTTITFKLINRHTLSS